MLGLQRALLSKYNYCYILNTRIKNISKYLYLILKTNLKIEIHSVCLKNFMFKIIMVSIITMLNTA